MRYAILADIHSNLEAFEAVLAACRQEGVRGYFCLGDTIGYGANPRECLDLLKELTPRHVAGNHEWGVMGRHPLDAFSDIAQKGILWTRSQLRDEDAALFARMPLVGREPDFHFVHATLNTPDQFIYLKDISQASETFFLMKENLCFVGHTHIPRIMVYNNHNHLTHYHPRTVLEVQKNFKYIVNVGSVGQPRDGSPLASYGIYDPDLARVEIKRAAYDVATAQRKILQSGLPDSLAQRLAVGV